MLAMMSRAAPRRVLVAVLGVLSAGCDVLFQLVPVPDAPRGPSSAARWDFDDGAGLLVREAADRDLDLVIDSPNNVRWSAGALDVIAPARLVTLRPAARLCAALKQARELSVEAWIQPASVTLPALTPGRVFTISETASGPSNIVLGQSGDRQWEARLRTSSSDSRGWPALTTGEVIADPPQLTHVVLVHDGTYRMLYVDGFERARDAVGGDLDMWSEAQPLGVANDVADPRPWLGALHRIEVFDRALDGIEIEARWNAGP
jgi:hypothetical protein